MVFYFLLDHIPAAQSAIRNPPSAIWDALESLTDSYRTTLLAAARGDRQKRKEAIATLFVWWDYFPAELRANVEAKITAWSADHPRATRRALAARRADLLLAAIRRGRRAPRTIGTAIQSSRSVLRDVVIPRH